MPPNNRPLLADAVFEWKEYAIADRYKLIESELPIVRRDLVVREALVRTGTSRIETTNIPTEMVPLSSQLPTLPTYE